MKKVILYITLILFALITTNVLAIDLTKWKYCSEITFDSFNAKYVKADIVPEVYNAAKSDLSDIRIIDSNDQQVPYMLIRPKDSTAKHKYLPTVINRSTDDNNNSIATLDFGKQTIKNYIEVESTGLNFRRAVKVEGSNDNVTFFTLIEQAFLFAIDNKIQSRFSNVDLPANDYRYLRITVSPMASEQQSPVIKELRTFNRDRKLANRTSAEMVLVNHTEDQEKKLTIYEYDLKFRNLPISEIQLSIDDESFYRYVTIQGRNASTRKIKIASEDNRNRYKEVEETWKSVTNGSVYRYISTKGKKHERTTLSVPSRRQAYRYIKITINNYDDRPLKLETASAKMLPHQIIFNAADNPNVTLYVGSESALKPEYDITHKLNKPLEIKAVLARLDTVSENPLFGKVSQNPIPWTEKHKALLFIIMAAVVLALGGFILRSFKSINSNQPQN